MVNIFVLEDRDERMPIMKKWLDGKLKGEYTLTRAKDVAAAIEALERDKFDIFFLDHDLDGKAFVPSQNENTGYQLAKWMNDNKIKYKQCFIHSMNPYGAYRMSQHLPNAIILPFSVLVES